MVTIEDVARDAGVSRGTASNVLNNRPSVSKENYDKVMNSMKKLHYKPNISARILKTNISKSIGLILPSIANPYYAELARGAEDIANKYSYTIFLCNDDRSIEKQRNYINILIEKSVDGLILVKPSISDEEIIEIQNYCKIVLIDKSNEGLSNFNIVNIDDYGGSIKAMNLLYEHGHRRIGFINGLRESKSSNNREQAYMDFFKSKKIAIDDQLILKGSFDLESGRVNVKKLLALQNPPTAIFAANDLMAIGAMEEAKKILDIPRDLSIIGYDDIDMASLYTPKLTTIQQPKYELGVLSAEKLIGIINAKTTNDDSKMTTLTTKLIVRESVAFVKSIN